METILLMVESASAYQNNAGRINEFIDQIFNDIQSEEQFSQNTSIIKMKEVWCIGDDFLFYLNR